MSTVLIIDDSATEVQMLKGILEGAGYETLAARTGEEGVEVAKTKLPDVILMDIVMPGMSGYEAKRSLARDPATNHIPVIFVSSRSADSDKVWGMRLGAAGYVTKPVNPDQLDSAMDGIFVA